MKQKEHIKNLIKCSFDIEKYKEYRKREWNYYNLLLDLYFYDEIFHCESFHEDNDFIDFTDIGSDRILDILSMRIENCDEKSNRKFALKNKNIIMGLIIVYAKEYDLYLMALLLLFLLKFLKEKEDILNHHIEFLRAQKRRDGRVGFLNPLLDTNSLDKESFYQINTYSLEVVNNYIKNN